MPIDTAPVRVVFMGTPDFAVPPLRALALHSEPSDLWPEGLALVGVVTRPDKTAGRGRQAVLSPVKQTAQELGIPVLQPGPLRKPEAFEQVRALEDAGVPCGAINDVAHVMKDPQVLARNMIIETLDPDLGPIKMQGNPIKLSAHEDPKTRAAAPDLDADRTAILKELGRHVDF